jgi:hypothetical protein
VAGGAEDVGSCDPAGNDQAKNRKNESELTRKIRINPSVSNLCQLKNNVQDDGGIGWLAIPHRRLEVNLFGGLDGIVIEAVT